MRGLTLGAGLVLLGIVDRFEGSWAVVEWRTDAGLVFQDLPRAWMPAGTREGDGLRVDLPDDCAGPDGLARFMHDAAACGGRERLRRAPPWTGSVHMQAERRQP